jgi:hypothetical protein
MINCVNLRRTCSGLIAGHLLALQRAHGRRFRSPILIGIEPSPIGGSSSDVCAFSRMNDRTTELESAVRAQSALIFEAQTLLAAYLAKDLESPALIDRLSRLLNGPQEREADRLAREALGENEPGNIA